MTAVKSCPEPTIPTSFDGVLTRQLLDLRRSGQPEVARRAAGLLLLADGYSADEAAAACGLTEAQLQEARRRVGHGIHTLDLTQIRRASRLNSAVNRLENELSSAFPDEKLVREYGVNEHSGRQWDGYTVHGHKIWTSICDEGWPEFMVANRYGTFTGQTSKYPAEVVKFVADRVAFRAKLPSSTDPVP